MRDRADPVAIRCTVTIVQKAPHLIPGEEPAVAETLADILREEAIDLRLSRTAVRAELHAERACLVLDDGSRLMAKGSLSPPAARRGWTGAWRP
jgi:pyruvate/2-oxoglutarate dehydrogenase complex dihydrolipoamide dehydrogenase (E3) component